MQNANRSLAPNPFAVGGSVVFEEERFARFLRGRVDRNDENVRQRFRFDGEFATLARLETPV